MLADWYLAPLDAALAVVPSTIAMYAVILLIARTSGVRSFAEMSPFDVVVTIAIGSLLATVVASKNPPLVQGVAAVVTLYAIQLLVSQLRTRFTAVERTTDTRPILLMGAGGEIKHENMRVARVTENDLRTHLRAVNVTDPSCVQAMVMEGTGTISVLHGDNGELAASAWVLDGVRDYSQAPS